MPDYSKGKIYKILNTYDNEVYVGSTIDLLSKRMYKHKLHCETKGNSTLYKHMRELDKSCFYIELIEAYPCASKEELCAKEGEWIRKVGTLNMRIAGRSPKERYNENIEVIRELDRERYKQNEKRHDEVKARAKAWKEEHTEQAKAKEKEWRENNKQYKREQDANYREANKEQIQIKLKEWYERNKDIVKDKAKQYRESNKEQIKEKSATRVLCECGRELRQGDISRHKKTNTHKQLMLELEQAQDKASD